jgi:hypothetical protein
MKTRQRILAVVGAALVTSAVVGGGQVAGAAGAPTGPGPGTPVRVQPDTVPGTYVLYANGDDFGPLVLNSNFTFSISKFGDTGVWISTGRSFAMSITASTKGDGGCTFSGTMRPDGINSSRPKKQGYYTCSGATALRWYAVRQPAS